MEDQRAPRKVIAAHQENGEVQSKEVISIKDKILMAIVCDEGSAATEMIPRPRKVDASSFAKANGLVTIDTANKWSSGKKYSTTN